MTITWQQPLNYRTVYVSGYKIIIRDLTDPTNVFDVVNLKLWNNNRHVVRKGIGKTLLLIDSLESEK